MVKAIYSWFLLVVVVRHTGYKKNEQLCFLYSISAPIKATEMVFIWKDKIDSIVRFEYKMDLESCIVAEIFSKWFGASIS